MSLYGLTSNFIHLNKIIGMRTNLVIVLFATLFFQSCDTDSPTDSTVQKSTIESKLSIDEKELLVSNYQYDTDWEVIKEAVLTNDLVTLQAYLNEKNVDPLELLSACNQEYIQGKLQVVSFADLEVDVIENEVFLVFFASGSGTFTMYLYQGEKSLIVDYFIVGG
jgi:hypothetical protein